MPRLHLPLPAALCLVLAAPLAAQSPGCVTAADLAGGIRVEYGDGTAEIYSRRDGAVVHVRGMVDDVPSYEFEIAHGTHLLSYRNIVDGAVDPASRQDYEYGIPPEEMPVPAPGGRWQASVTVTSAEGDRQEAQSQVYDAAGTVSVGACTYATLPAIIAYDTADAYMEGIRVLPELGIGYMLWNETDGVRSETVRVVSISAVK
ncbi:hypothetical protein [Wenxinia saemankumensis]|uniref:DUF3108 domain-containing protein n=1 Tax=Wenxinia saemankumensis TaxID=1447782 RepID=A0A1M6ER09_9RHOB|nr:hypothetical protein [Wenxinia saemankumensis]SHI87924.1 hypothetical protein SAMN05444417_2130 [Wenxinia saemankumensis]